MDLNYLFKREQISLVNAQRAHDRNARAAHAELARGYAGLIAARRSPYLFLKAPAVPRA